MHAPASAHDPRFPRLVALLTALTLAAALVIGCGGATTTPDPGAADGDSADAAIAESIAANAERDDVVIAFSTDMQGINPLITRNTSIHSLLSHYALYANLLEEQADYHEGPPSFQPRLATGYSFSDDGLTLTLPLNPDARWSDGEPITAEDVRWTWQAQMHPAIAWPYAEAKKRIRDVEAVDPHTVRIHFVERYPEQLLDAVEGPILPKHAWSELPFEQWRDSPGWFDERPVFSGPFVLERWVPNQRIVLARNPQYKLDASAQLTRVTIRIIPDQAGQLAALRSGEIDVLEVPPPAEVAALAAAPTLEVLSYIPRQFVFLLWNTQRPYFADAAVRRALTQAIDRQAIIDGIYHGRARLTASPYPSNSWVYNEALTPLGYDLAAARAALDAAGWRDSDDDGVRDRDGQPFRFELLTNSDNQLRMDILVLVQNQLAQLGIDAQPRGIEFNTLVQREFAHDFDASLTSLGIATTMDLSFNFGTEFIDGGYNWGSFSSPEVDAVLAEIKAAPDPAAAKPQHDRLQVLLQDAQPITLLYEPERVVVVRRGLSGVEPNALSTFFHLRRWHWASAP
ncbi:MAG: ABC transporter substrate-binding protein [Acidobacteriota bacterium]